MVLAGNGFGFYAGLTGQRATSPSSFITSRVAPFPWVPKGLRLRFRGYAARLEQNIIVRVRFEWRVEIDEIDRLVLDLLPKHIEIVAEIELVHRHSPRRQDRCAW